MTLEVDCIGRLYLNGYSGNLAAGGQWKVFLNQQLEKPYASPVLLGPMTRDGLNATYFCQDQAWGRSAEKIQADGW